MLILVSLLLTLGDFVSCTLGSSMVSQTVLRNQVYTPSDNWIVVLSKEWDVLGPFSIHAREQHYLSPSFPLTLSDPINFTKSYPSSLADNGEVFWSTRTATAAGELKVSFPNIRWDNIRNTEGWAGLQHHSVLHTSITIYPPEDAEVSLPKSPRLLVSLVQGSFFTILATNDAGKNRVPRWYAGDIYAMERALPRSVELPMPPSLTSPTTYDIFVSGDYEMRLFGDPQVDNSNNTPVLTLSLSIDVAESTSTSDLVLTPSLDVFPDSVDGWSFGTAIGVSVRSFSSKWWVAKEVVLPKSRPDGVRVELVSSTSIAPTQTRLIPLKLTQTRPFDEATITFHLVMEQGHCLGSNEATLTLPVTLNFNRLSHWSISPSNSLAVKATYFYSSFAPTAFLVKPPREVDEVSGITTPPIIALHGAGVDIFSSPFWNDALPRQRRSWTIMPSGRTSWGLDWHGPSVTDVWSCLEALIDILETDNQISPSWSSWKIVRDTRVVLIGHSNGGQGAWYISERYPDRVIAVAPAAAYIKSQAYVPLTHSRSAHFIDPALRSILEASLVPDDNDLFLSNLVDMPIMAIHGGEDENVPTWHSRQAVSVLKAWNPEANVTLKEDPGQLHWYGTVFSDRVVQDFIHAHVDTDSAKIVPEVVPPDAKSFTLTVAIPAESDTLHGFRVERLCIPGRLSRLQVTRDSSGLSIRTTNIVQFTMRISGSMMSSTVYVDGAELSLKYTGTKVDFIRLSKDSGKNWQVKFPAITTPDIQTSGRLSLILMSDAPIRLIIPTPPPDALSPSLELTYALRIAHDLATYHRLESEIILDDKATLLYQTGSLGTGNIVVIDGPSSKTSFGTRLLERNMTDIRRAEAGSLTLNDTPLGDPATGLAFLHPHPERSDACILFLCAEDESGMESIMRLFPIRSGVAVPDWVVVGPHAQALGAAGVKGAGVWGNGWRWNEATSWFD